ncbi:rhodanese-like domain-containing protein [Pseudofulvibacter geojedonensis]|uniref:Rhodanese-like domain-containing protein n=1 Tax=Pseudofulvibacter geojedonensis TaxID=1123758 RepID=A0ABW3I5S4_9FLAO
MTDLNQKEWAEQLAKDDNAIVLDVRTQEEVEEGFIPNAINIDVREPQQFLDQINELDKSKNYYVYCRSGGRSSQACAVMNQMCAIPNTFNLVGGFMEWAGEVSHN